MLIKVQNSVECWLKSTKIQPIKNKKCGFSDPLGPTKDIKICS